MQIYVKLVCLLRKLKIKITQNTYLFLCQKSINLKLTENKPQNHFMVDAIINPGMPGQKIIKAKFGHK